MLGLDLAAGTITDGWKRLGPLFPPILEALRKRNAYKAMCQVKKSTLILLFRWAHVRRDILSRFRDSLSARRRPARTCRSNRSLRRYTFGGRSVGAVRHDGVAQAVIAPVDPQ